MLSQIKNFIKRNNTDIFIVLTVTLVALISFGIGRLTAPKTEPIQIKNLEKADIEQLEIFAEQENSEDLKAEHRGKVVASSKSDKYHLPDCPGAKQISEQNKIWFDSIEAAEKAGYNPAGNCPGLQK